MKNFVKTNMNKIGEKVDSFKKSLEESLIYVEAIQVINDQEDLKIVLELKDHLGKEYSIDITNTLQSIISVEVENKNIQKIYRELPRSIEYHVDGEKGYIDKLLLYKILYEACKRAGIVNKKVYTISE